METQRLGRGVHQAHQEKLKKIPCKGIAYIQPCNAGDLGSISGLGRCPGEEKGYPLQYSGLENSMDYTVHGIAKSQTRLSHFHFHFQPLHRKEPTALRRTELLESREEGGLMGRGLQKQARGTGPVEGLGGSPKNNGKDCKQRGLGQVCTIKSLCKMSWKQEYQLEDYFYQGRDWIIFTRKMVGVEIWG